MGIMEWEGCDIELLTLTLQSIQPLLVAYLSEISYLSEILKGLFITINVCRHLIAVTWL